MNLSKKNGIYKVLVVRLSSMGDIILTSPVISHLRALYPDAQIDFLLSKPFKEIYEFNPNISNIISYDKSLDRKNIIHERNRVLKCLKVDQYDLVIDLQNNLRSKIYTKGIYKDVRRIKKNRFHKLSLVYLKKSRKSNDFHIVNNYLDTIATTTPFFKKLGLELWQEKENIGSYPSFKKEATLSTIGFAPAAQHKTKQWPKEKYIQLGKRISTELNAKIMLFGGKDDLELCNEIQNELPNAINKAGSTSILQTAKDIDLCDMMITNDTGVMHIAAARRKPIVAIFGSTVTELGFAPYGVPFEVAEVNLSCRPCTHIGRSECPKKHFECMSRISTDMVFELIQKLSKAD